MSQDNQTIIDKTVDLTFETYKAQSVILDHGEGVYAYDTDGKKYLDFAAGIAVASLGHAHPKMLEVINEQAGKLMACQGSYVTEPKLEAAQILVDNGCFDKVFFSNSGTESVECALKMARKWAYDNKGEQATEIIAFRNSFHGRTYGSASVTEKRLSQAFFEPYIPDVHFADFNDFDGIEDLFSEKTAAVIIEPVQGEGGLNPASPCFLRHLRNLCDRHKVVLIFDEVQCGSGRIGTFYAYQSFSCCNLNSCNNGKNPVYKEMKLIEPDIACLAKGMGSGFPVGAVVAKKQFADAMVIGTHGTTYGGNPLACAVVACVLGEIAQPEFLEHVQEMGALLRGELQKIKEKSNKITDISGIGLMLGFESVVPVKEMIGALHKNGLMTTQSGASLVRLTPPLIITKDEIMEAVSIIDKTLHQDF